jgi:pimeloyl-ACP methyl ester carboxylesterase
MALRFLLSAWGALALCVGCAGGDGRVGAPDVSSDGQASVSELGSPKADAAQDDSLLPDVPSEQVWHDACPEDGIEERLIDVGEVTLNVACRGSGPTVVFLHGFPEFHYSWKRVMDELASEYRLVAPDQRGFNLSDKPADIAAYGIQHLMEDIRLLIPIISPDPVLLVGHDWGGPVGWMVAHHPEAGVRGYLAVNGPHPHRFATLIENDPAQKEASAYMDFFRMEGSEDFLTPDYFAQDFASFLTEDELARYVEAWSQPGAITGGLNWYRANSLAVSDVEEGMASLLEQIPFPVSVLWGLDDAFVLPQNAEGLEVYAPDLVVETFPGVDHWIEHRIPEEVARAIRELDARAVAVTKRGAQ